MYMYGHVLLIIKFILAIWSLKPWQCWLLASIYQLFSNKFTSTFLIHVSFSNSHTKILKYLVQAGCHDNHDIIQKTTINLIALVQEGRNCIISLQHGPSFTWKPSTTTLLLCLCIFLNRTEAKAISQAHTLNCTTKMWRRKQLRIVCLQSKHVGFMLELQHI